jgi:type I restriction enzyme, S subunit
MVKYLIGDFLKRIRRPIKLIPNQKYKLVTIKLNHKGVVLREIKKGSNIKSNMFEVKEGDFILSGIDARNGAFGIVPKELNEAIVTNDFWYFEIDEKIINKYLFLELTSTSWFDNICKNGSDGTTQRIRLQKDKFFDQEVFLPEPDRQIALLNKIQKVKNLQFEINKSQRNSELLMQAILKEAFEE